MPTKQPQIESFVIHDFAKIHNHMCSATVVYDDGNSRDFIARVILNAITGKWTVDAMHHAWVYEEE